MRAAAFVARWAALTTMAALVWMLATGGAWAADLVIINARLFAGTDAPVLEHANIAITDGRIEAISTDAMPTAGAQIIDAAGRTAMPGLIDAHIHLFFALPAFGDTTHGRPWSPQSEAEARAYINGKLREKLEALLQHGFTSILSAVDFWPLIVEVRERVAYGELQGPRLFVSGGAFTAPQPHPFCGGNTWCPEQVQAGSPEQARDWVRRYAESGVDQIAVTYDPTVKPEPLTPETLRAITDEAHRRHLRVLLEGRIDATAVPDLVRWGIDGFLHSPGVVLDSDGSLLASAGTKHLPLTLTLGNQEESHRLSPQVSAGDMGEYRILRANTLTLLKAGGTAVWGSDLGDRIGMTPTDLIRIETRSLSGLGLTPVQILHAATRDAARSMLGREDLGTLETGNIADVILVDGDPLKDPEALTKVVLVIKDGKVVADHSNR
ncbi:MAG: amidohydrolase family protein [Steroidobacteraceae bacterium]